MGESNTPNTELPETMSIEIEVSDTQAHMKVNHHDVIELARGALLIQNRANASISIVLVDNDTIHRLNRLHLSHDWPTDVITFPLSGPEEPELAGELVVSTEMAVAAARESGGKPRRELALYLVHGLLHLCGYDDRTEAESAAMNREQTQLVEALAHSWHDG
jgi:probable rRNA maturation factor